MITANGLQDAVVGAAELAANAALKSGNPMGPSVSLPSPDWSRGLIVHEPGEEGTWSDSHGWSKFLTAAGAPGSAAKLRNVVTKLGGWVKAAPKAVPNPVQQIGDDIKAWLGEGYIAKPTPSGDMLFMSKDGLRKFRTDFYHKRQEPPHIHFQEKNAQGDWVDVFTDLPHKIILKPEK